MKEKPILFSAPMVRAILEGRKTQTRRLVKPQPPEWVEAMGYSIFTPDGYISGRGTQEVGGFSEKAFLLKYKTGDKLWVKETFCLDKGALIPFYRATEEHPEIFPKWIPSIFMPRLASRISLEVTKVRLERLQEITEDDAEKEGVSTDFEIRSFEDRDYKEPFGFRYAFSKLWDSINRKKYPWDCNPWVWVIDFKVMEVKG